MMTAQTRQPLTDDEIHEFWVELQLNPEKECLCLSALGRKLEQVHDDLSPRPSKHNLNHPDRSAARPDKADDAGLSDLQIFLRTLTAGHGDSVTLDEFTVLVRSWNIPSQHQDSEDAQAAAAEYEQKLSYRRRWWLWWCVKGPEAAFIAFVVALQLAFGTWQFYKYLNWTVGRAALGWGPVVAKLATGVLYPTLFFLILSMSRWFATFCRRSYTVSRIINWDYSQRFHIIMAIVTTFFATMHAIGHLTGTFVDGSLADRQEAVAMLWGVSPAPRTYLGYVKSLPGWTGLMALCCLYIIGLTGSSGFRKKHYELFQLAHLLMYPMFAVLAAHGVRATLQYPMLGYWLAFPVLLVLAERATRVARSFLSHTARLEALDDGTVVITVEKPKGKKWKAQAGQYVLVQVPAISRFQWHPFTISACIGTRLHVHIKADGDWTTKLHELAIKAKSERGSGEQDFVGIKVGIDGPFGAPAQRFWSYDKAIIIGAGIGITPFAAILTDLEENYKAKGDPWQLTRATRFKLRKRTTPGESVSQRAPVHLIARASTTGTSSTLDDSATLIREETLGQGGLPSRKTSSAASTLYEIAEPMEVRPAARPTSGSGSHGLPRVDLHWVVREKTHLLWFSDLLNRASTLAEADLGKHLTLNIHAHVTQKRKELSTHIFRYLLDAYHTPAYPHSTLTGLRTASHFGRPDFERILTEFYQDMKAQGWQGRIGVFVCGPPVISEQLADLCEQLTQRARSEGFGMHFVMQIEVFN